MRIVFFGTAEFGEPTLRMLNREHAVDAVVTTPDTKRGRGRKELPPPMKTVADELGLRVLQPADLEDTGFVKKLSAVGADLFFVVAFRILPPAVFGLPPKGTVNLHASLLPDYRGAAPINWAIVNGDDRTGLTTFFITEEVDTGDIILTEEVAIGPDETAGELYDRMKMTGGDLAARTVTLIEQGEARPRKQPPAAGRPAPKLSREDGRIDWSASARAVHNLVRGMTPLPGAYSESRMGPVKILRTEVIDEGTSGAPGRILACSTSDGIIVSCGRGSVRIIEMQPPGRRVVSSGSFVCGHRVEEGMTVRDII